MAQNDAEGVACWNARRMVSTSSLNKADQIRRTNYQRLRRDPQCQAECIEIVVDAGSYAAVSDAEQSMKLDNE